MRNSPPIGGSARERALQILWRVEGLGAFADRLLYAAATQAGLSDHELRDLGIGRSQVNARLERDKYGTKTATAFRHRRVI